MFSFLSIFTFGLISGNVTKGKSVESCGSSALHFKLLIELPLLRGSFLSVGSGVGLGTPVVSFAGVPLDFAAVVAVALVFVVVVQLRVLVIVVKTGVDDAGVELTTVVDILQLGVADVAVLMAGGLGAVDFKTGPSELLSFVTMVCVVPSCAGFWSQQLAGSMRNSIAWKGNFKVRFIDLE